MAHFLINGRQGAHVQASPLPPEKFGLQFERLQRVQLHDRIADTKSSFQYSSRLEEHQDQHTGSLPLGQFIENADEIDAGVQIAPAVSGRLTGGL